MSARPIAAATVSFGLVSIPVKLYSTKTSDSISFNMLHKKCNTRVKQKYYCPKDNDEVGRSDIIKGYEFTKGQWVLFSDEEIKNLQEKASQSIDIAYFVPLAKVDPIYFDKVYYLGPDKGGDRAYRLLSEALLKSNRAGLARYAARGKQYLVLLRPIKKGLVMQQLRYADEVRPASDVPLGDARVTASELKLALQIIEQGVVDEFRPEEFEDDVRRRMLEAIERKQAGEEITAAPEEPKAQIIDLMDALKASLSKSGAAGAARKPARHAPRKGGARKAKAQARKPARGSKG